MAPPLIALLFLILIAAIVVLGGLFAIRAGLWVRQTDPDAEPPRDAAGHPKVDEPRPVHRKVEDPAKQQYLGT